MIDIHIINNLQILNFLKLYENFFSRNNPGNNNTINLFLVYFIK